MAQVKSDGTVYIDTKVDTSGIDVGLSTTKNKINTVVNSIAKLGASIKKAFSGEGMTQGVDSGVANYESQIKKLELELDKLIEKQIRFVETGGNTKSRTFAGMEYDIQQVSTKLEELRAKKHAFEELGASEMVAVDNASMLKNTVNLIKSSFANLVPNLKIASKTLMNFAGRKILNGIRKLGTGVKNLAKSMLSVGSSAKKSNRSMLKMLGTSLLFSTVFRAISSLINSFKEGLQNLAQYSTEANTSMSALKTATSQLKNSLATAFMPLITLVTPALVSFINVLNKAFTSLGAFFSALSGKSTFAKAVTVQHDYANELKETSKNAKDAKKSLNQYLSGLDEIKTFTAKQNETEDETAISPKDMFTEESIPVDIMTFAEKLKSIIEEMKKYFKNQDWKGLGKYLADGVNIALQKMYDVLNWQNVEKKIMPFIIGLTNTFNSFVDNMDWELMGRTVGTGVNTLVNTIYELVTRIDWKNLGTKFGESINGVFKEIDWSKAGTTLSESIKGLLDLIIGFIEEVDWQQIGNSVAEFIGGIDWSGLANRLFEGIGAVLGGLTAFLWGLIEEAWYKVVKWWKDVAFEDGKFTMQGLLDGVLDKLKDIGNWIKTNIFEPFIKGFKEAFGIHSPSTVMFELGTYLLQGLLDGIKSLVGEFEKSIEDLRKIISDKFEGVKKTWEDVWNNLSEKVTNVWKNIKETVSGAIDKMKGWISDLLDKFNDAKSKLSSLSSSKGTSKLSSVLASIGSYSSIGNIKIPKLATGSVIPPNSPFLAVLGDQKSGTNVEAPLSTIEQAVRNVVGNGTGAVVHAHLYLDGKEILTSVIDTAKFQQATTGLNPLLLG